MKSLGADQVIDYSEEDFTKLGQICDAVFETVGGDDWHRMGLRSDGAEFTIETFAQYVIHDPMHHLWDVQDDADRGAGPAT